MNMLILTTLVLAQATNVLGANWSTYNGDLAGTRFSPLTEISTANVHRLRLIAKIETGVDASFQTSPLVVNGTMFFTTYKHTYAVDGATGKIKWKDVRSIPMKDLSNNNRGAAYADGKLFRGYNDGLFAAFDATTGKRLWTTKIARPEKGESMPIAPVAWDGKVFVGNSGGDARGVTGRIYALDEKNGERVWQFDTVPTTGKAAATWLNKGLAPAGGGTWSSYSIDTAEGVLYASVGNPAPDFDLALRPGQNLYTDCVVALDVKTGGLLAYTQPTKNDAHDWDIAAAPALITTRAGKRLAAVGGKDGLLHGIDRRNVAKGGAAELPVLYATPITRRFNVDIPLSTKHSTRFAPGTQGGMEWNGPSYDPATNLLFTGAIDWPSTIRLAERKKTLAVPEGKPWTGADDNGFGKTDKTWAGCVTATDADSGKIRWKFKTPAPIVAGVTSTAGGVVFAADAEGVIRAFDAKTGKVLWIYRTERACGGGISSYSIGKHQYIAVVAGPISWLWRPKPMTCEVLIFRLR